MRTIKPLSTDSQLIEKALEWNLFPVFFHTFVVPRCHVLPGHYNYLERLIVKLKRDPSYKKHLNEQQIGCEIGILIMALRCLNENAVIYFLSGMEIRIDRYVYHFDSVLGDERLADIRKLYEKHKTEIDKQFIIVFPQ